jgi:HAD superfamily hydrolase (TIGR01490 family)
MLGRALPLQRGPRSAPAQPQRVASGASQRPPQRRPRRLAPLPLPPRASPSAAASPPQQPPSLHELPPPPQAELYDARAPPSPPPQAAPPPFALQLPAPSASQPPRPAAVPPIAFFDVDGTLVRSNIVVPWLLYRASRMPAWRRALAAPLAALAGAFFWLLDRVSRTAFNTLFYRSYRGFPAAEQPAMAAFLMSSYYAPRLLAPAAARVAELRAAGARVVLLTGSLDFLMRPLAAALGAHDALCASLEVDASGAATGRLAPPGAVSGAVKAELAAAYAAAAGVDLADCEAYGDSYADLELLRAVGRPTAVSPDRRLAAAAAAGGWPVVRWRQKA